VCYRIPALLISVLNYNIRNVRCALSWPQLDWQEGELPPIRQGDQSRHLEAAGVNKYPRRSAIVCPMNGPRSMAKMLPFGGIVQSLTSLEETVG
jgi:hypothetical protein